MLNRETAIRMAQYNADRRQVVYCVFRIKDDDLWHQRPAVGFAIYDPDPSYELVIPTMPPDTRKATLGSVFADRASGKIGQEEMESLVAAIIRL